MANVNSSIFTSLDDQQNPASPYYLHPGDNPGSVVASPILEGTKKYQIWYKNMSNALICRDKLGFVDGSIPMPKITDSLHSAWCKCNTMVISWITRFVSSQIAHSISFFDTGVEIWNDLRVRFSDGDSFRLADLLE
jgi:hypothetical protein